MTDDSRPLTRAEQIAILMAEYNTLRSEIIQKNTSAFQIYGVAGSAAVAISVIIDAYSVAIGVILFYCFRL